MVNRRAANSPLGQSIPWFVAAILAIVGSGVIAWWLTTTAHNADVDTLDRGADAITSNVEEQIRILELAGSGTRSLSGQSTDDINLQEMVGEIDISALGSLIGVISYPVDENGAGEGASMLPEAASGLVFFETDAPPIDLSLAEFDELLDSGDAFFSSPFTTGDDGRLDYVVAMPVRSGGVSQLVGVVFRPDRMLTASVDAAGEGQYAVELVDVRYDRRLVTTVGEIASDLETRRSPEGVLRSLELVVKPGPDFRSVRSPWITSLVMGTGVAIALLLFFMGRMAKARAAELAERLRLAQELNESKDRFLATVSHELRTPLTVVLGVASEVGPNWEQFDNTDRQDLMTMMMEQASEAANIVEDLLVAARSDPSQLRLAMDKTPLSPHVEYALASLPDDARQRVRSQNVEQVVYADSTRLRQILRNLLENAVKYGGPDIAVESSISSGLVQVVVSDDGRALIGGDLERIFEPYEQSGTDNAEAPSGVGIGLYVSRLLARLMNGELDCVQENGRTCFRLRLAGAQPIEARSSDIGAAAG